MRASIPSIAPTPMSRSSAWPGAFPARRTSTCSGSGCAAGDDCLADIDPAELIGERRTGVERAIAELRAPERPHRRRRRVRPRLLRLQPAARRRSWIRSTGTSSSASWEALEDAGHTPEAVRRLDRRLRRVGHEHLPPSQPAHQPDRLMAIGGLFLAPPHGQRQGLPHHAVVVPPRPARARRSTSRPRAPPRSSRCTSPCQSLRRLRVRPRAGRRRHDRAAPRPRVPLPGGRDPLARRALPGVRRARRTGTVFGSGAGVVVAAAARRRARRRRHRSTPSIKGSAVNNDGERKVGYLAPSVDGQAEAVAEALAVSGVDPRTSSLRRGARHRNARRRPDRGRRRLTEAFRSSTDRTRASARIGSTKTEHRPPRHGRGRRQPRSRSCRRSATARCRPWPTTPARTRCSTSSDTPFVVSGTAAPWSGTGPLAPE